MSKSLNLNLNQAKKIKNDEFYTQMSDIEKEVWNYKDHFKGKVIYCNCDNYSESHFYKYFALNFEFFGLKKLIATFYNEERAVFKAELLEYDTEPSITQLKGNGDFRSLECIELLKEADIVVTNPPFSLFREYVAQLMTYDKKFIIMGSMNAVDYKEVFPLIMDNKIWLGHTKGGSKTFRVPEDYNGTMKVVKDSHNNKVVSLGNVTWYTNLEHARRNEEIILWSNYTPDKYPKYVNYDAINVDRVKDIPKDYYGVIGVPISFLDSYNPNQFEIIGHTKSHSIRPTKQLIVNTINDNGSLSQTTMTLSVRALMYNELRDKKPKYKDVASGDLYVTLYSRMLIKRKPEVM